MDFKQINMNWTELYIRFDLNSTRAIPIFFQKWIKLKFWLPQVAIICNYQNILQVFVDIQSPY